MNNYTKQLNDTKAKDLHQLKEVGDQWRTPDDIFWGIFANFGPFVLDLFTDGDNAKCERFYTCEQNALIQDWAQDLQGGKAYANPPYSRSSYEDGQAITGMRNIINKAIAEREQGAKLVFLIKAATSETWWPEEADHVCFIKGRVGFDLPKWFKGKDASSSGFASAIVIFDKNWKGSQQGYISRDQLKQDGNTLMKLMQPKGYRPTWDNVA
ncbi:phage N-6-adenine-methyltransferase [Shewanella sp. 202IG2-18]|uniref:phage N-6-adenine-methyltransferase n=1 Tax=Parashewanella hymeniacidonis TaxID=2807618 RepID=UPI00195F9386|nr:phage N-6-adenine-methyltransferase [Parashewanella hymeniacidonis]MBM7070918.1 phage N-6-adenine-methyltransferase [Parashewanella hymeniacidonis]